MDDRWAVQMWHGDLEWMHVRKIDHLHWDPLPGRQRKANITLQRNLEPVFELTYEAACALSREVTRSGKTTRIYRVGTEDYIMGDIL